MGQFSAFLVVMRMRNGRGDSQGSEMKRYMLAKLWCPVPALSYDNINIIVIFPNYITSDGFEVGI
jgi:hypothetical protein